jgi:protein arginine N-methyltransferase 5
MTNGHNIRLSSHTFHIPRQSICHGLAGYFEAHLWGNVVLSIHPDAARTTAGMQSWFPLYFPFKQPLVLSADSELDVFLWRMTSNDRVWYEWMAQSYVLTSRPLRALSMGMDSESTFHSKQSSSQTGSTHMQRNGSGSRTEKDTLMVSGNEAFQNAPNTPRLMDGQQLANDLGASYERVLVGMTSLMNPGGRSSSVRM